MDKLGVKMQILKVGSFKSAVEPYFRTSMSDESRLQTQVYIDSIWNYMSGAIAEGFRHQSSCIADDHDTTCLRHA